MFWGHVKVEFDHGELCTYTDISDNDLDKIVRSFQHRQPHLGQSLELTLWVQCYVRINQ